MSGISDGADSPRSSPAALVVGRVAEIVAHFEKVSPLGLSKAPLLL